MDFGLSHQGFEAASSGLYILMENAVPSRLSRNGIRLGPRLNILFLEIRQ